MMTPETIHAAVKQYADDIAAWTQTLVRFPSENRPPNGSEGEAQGFVADQCRALGLDVDVFSPEDVPGIQAHPSWLAGRCYDNDRNDVVARWQGSGGGRSLLLSGHIDVAPYEPDDWKCCRPYEPVTKDGKLYGRGAADMKGGLAAAFWAVRILKDLGYEPAGDVLFESVVDEEFAGGNGTLAARLGRHNADLAVIPEPTQMKVCPACFGALLGDLTITGQAGMPYTGTAISNPVDGAARAVQLFNKWQTDWRARNDHPMFRAPGQELNTIVWKIDSTRPGEFTQLGTPLQVKLSWVTWCHPGMSEEAFLGAFRAFWDEHIASDPALAPFDIRLEQTHHYVKPWETPVDDPGVKAIAAALESGGCAAEITGFQASCDLAIYGEAGMPSVILGPRGGNLHAPDEWVEVEDLLTLTHVYADLIVRWSGCNAEGGRRRV